MEVAFTLGSRQVYDPYIASDPNPMKAKGGSVWKNLDEAEAYLKQCGGRVALFDGVLVDADTYQVELPNGWDRDTVPVPGVLWRTVMVDARLHPMDWAPLIIVNGDGP